MERRKSPPMPVLWPLVASWINSPPEIMELRAPFSILHNDRGADDGNNQHWTRRKVSSTYKIAFWISMTYATCFKQEKRDRKIKKHHETFLKNIFQHSWNQSTKEKNPKNWKKHGWSTFNSASPMSTFKYIPLRVSFCFILRLVWKRLNFRRVDIKSKLVGLVQDQNERILKW